MANTNITYEVSVQEGYTRWAVQYDQDNNALIVVEERLTIPLLATVPMSHILDLGAGTGRYAIRLVAQWGHIAVENTKER